MRHTPEQELLLRAALLGGDEARASWEEWRARVLVDDADHPSQMLLPLVYWNLSRLGIDDPDLGRMKGYLRRTLYSNHVLFAAAGSAISALHDVGIDTLVLKGAPLAILHYGSPGLRPMADVDILVPTDRALAAIRLLREHGWNPVDYGHPEDMIGLRHAEGFRCADGATIDLHWNALMQPFRDDDLWEASDVLEVGGVATRAPCATDLLLLVIAHSLLHGESSGGLHWITDSATLLRPEAPEIRWDRLVDAAGRRQLTLPLAAGLGYLRTLLGAVPADVIAALDRLPTRRLERAALQTAAGDGGRLGRMMLIADRYSRLRRLDTPFPRPEPLIYLARSLGHPTRRRFVAASVRDVTRRALRPRRPG